MVRTPGRRDRLGISRADPRISPRARHHAAAPGPVSPVPVPRGGRRHPRQTPDPEVPMTAKPPTVSEQATVARAAAAKQQLEDAIEDAAFLATIETADDGASLHVTIYSSKCPFADSVEEATQWLHQTGIDATAARDTESFRVVLTLPSADSVRMFIAALLQPWITARTTAGALTNVLSGHGIDSTIDVGTTSLSLLLADDELDSAVLLARLLGAPDIGTDLPRHRRRGIRHLTERVRWLITGAVGSPVSPEVEHGCEHGPDRLTIGLTLDQARRLTDRLGPDLDASPARGLTAH